VQIQPLEIRDYESVRELWEASPGVGLSNADSPRALERFLARNPGLSFVALEGDACIGSLLCGHDGRRGYLYHLAVAPDHRRTGLGRHLLARAEAALREEGIEKLHAFVFRDNGEGAAFWRAADAMRRDDLTVYSREIG
jgi:ribosomal protein S18 acetylase RimI-like enzyme